MKIIRALALLLLPTSLLGQTENVGNFPSPVRTIHYQSGTSPLGAFPIWTTRGIYFYSIDTDTIRLTKFGTKEESMNNRLLWIKTNGDLSCFTPDYIKATDTTSMLSPYIRSAQVADTYYPLTNPSGYINSAAIAGKLNISDTSNMLTGYLRKIDTTDKWQFKGNYIFVSDTASMLTNYLRKVDTLFMMSGYLRKVDTAAMLLGYQRKASVKRVETYLSTTDGSGNYTVTFSPAYSSAPHVQAVLISPTTQQQVRTVTVSTTGFTVNATNRATVTLLGVDVLLGATTALSGASVSVLVVER